MQHFITHTQAHRQWIKLLSNFLRARVLRRNHDIQRDSQESLCTLLHALLFHKHKSNNDKFIHQIRIAMNRKFKEKQIIISVSKKHPYIPPQCNAISVEKTHLICTSIVPKSDDTKEDDYEDRGEQDNGDSWDIGIGF